VFFPNKNEKNKKMGNTMSPGFRLLKLAPKSCEVVHRELQLMVMYFVQASNAEAAEAVEKLQSTLRMRLTP